MPVERYKNVQRTYFAKKMLTYYEANRQRRHVHDLGIENFRVLTVTTKPTRVEQMLNALDAITNGKGSNIFLFTDQAALAASNPLDVEWMSGKREAVRLTTERGQVDREHWAKMAQQSQERKGVYFRA